MKRLLLLLLPLLALSCEGFFSEGGIGGTGVTKGPITGLGSIFVNGIEWDVAGAEIELDGLPGSETDLSVGMVVRVEGTIDLESGRGVATSVRFDDDIEGPVREVVDVGVEGDTKQLEILDQLVLVELDQTIFAGEDPLFDFDTLDADDVVQVSGLIDDEGVIHATHVKKKGVLEIGETEVELSGEVEAFEGGDVFELGRLTVFFDPTGVETDLSELEGGLENGVLVDVRGVLEEVDQVFAERIERVSEDEEPEGEAAIISGFVSGFVDTSDFLVGHSAVDASMAVFERGNESQLDDGVKVEVEGTYLDGVLVADRVRFIDRWEWDHDDSDSG
jgi:hypothetical protein